MGSPRPVPGGLGVRAGPGSVQVLAIAPTNDVAMLDLGQDLTGIAEHVGEGVLYAGTGHRVSCPP